MKLFLVRLHNNNPPILTFGKTRALVGRQMKKFLGHDMVDEVIPVSNQDAEAQYGYNYKQQARWNMVRSESMDNTSMLTGDNPFLREKMDMKKADMGDVIDDFYKSDAPQFDGKSKAKRRQMAIAAKLQANEEEKQHYKLSAVSEGVDQKVLTQFKTMLKDGEEDSVRLLLQGMPKHTKKMYMSRLGLKESEKIDARTKAFKETVQRLNKSKQLEIPLPESEENLTAHAKAVRASQQSSDNKGHYKMTYIKRSSKDNKAHLDVHHTAIDFKGETPDNVHRVRALVKDSPQHKAMKAKGYTIDKYGDHDSHDSHERIHGTKPNITKENVEDIEEKTPIKLMVKDKKLPNLKVPNPNHKRYGELINKDKKDKKPSRDIYRETKEAPAGTYFTKSGQLKKGDPASDGPGGEKLASDPLDKQRKTIVNLKNYPK